MRIARCGIRIVILTLIVGLLFGWLADLSAPTAADAFEPVCGDTWSESAVGNWSEGGHWSTGAPPAAGEVACVGAGASVQITGGSNQAALVEGGGALTISGGTLELTGAISGEGSSIGTLTLSAGTLDVAGTLGVTKAFTATGDATISGGGTVTVEGAATGTLESTSTGCQQLTVSGSGTTLANQGTLRFTGFTNEGNNGEVRLSSGARLVNAGTFVDDAQDTFGFGCGGDASVAGAGSFANSGTLVKDAGTAVTAITVPFENTGTVNVQSGQLSPTGGGSSTGGTWTTATSASAGFSTGSFTSTNDNASGAHFAVSGGTLTVSGGSFALSTLSLSGGTVAMPSGTMALSTLSLGGGTLEAGAAVNVSKTLTATGDATIAGGGTVTLASTGTGTLEYTGSGCTELTVAGSGSTLVNDGTLRFTGFTNEGNNGEVRLSSGARLVNAGTFVDDVQDTFGFGCGGDASVAGSGTFANSGTLVKDAGSATTTVAVPFENSGTVNVQSGAFSPQAGGTSTAGTWSTSNGATVSFSSGIYTSRNDNATGAQFAIASGGELAVPSGTLSLSALALTGGSLEVGGAVDVAKTLTATDDTTISGGGSVTIGAAATGTLEAQNQCVQVTVAGTGTRLINDGTLRFSGFTSEGNNGEVRLSTGARLVNNGTFVDDAQDTFGFGCGGDSSVAGSGAFANSGTLVKDAGSATTTVAVPFENTGTVNVQSGSFSPTAGGSSTGGTWTTAAGASVAFTTGTFTSTNDTASNAQVALSGGVLNVPSGSTSISTLTISGSGALNVAGAVTATKSFTAAQNGTVSGGGTLTIASAATGTIEAGFSCTDLNVSGSGTNLVNDGVLRFSGFTSEGNNGEVRIGSGARITNAGTFTDNAEDTSGFGCGGDASLTGAGSFANTGTLTKSAGTHATTIAVPVTNSGTVNVQSGTLALQGNFTNSKLVSLGAGDRLQVSGNYTQTENGTLKTAIASASSYGALSASGTSTLAGLLELVPVNGFAGELGQSFAILSSSGQAGVFSFVSGAAIGGDLSYEPNYTSNGVTLVVVSSEGRQAPPPKATAPPTISGTPEQGQTLVLTHGSWEHSPGEFVDQWLRCNSGGCVPIPGATGQTYVVGSEDTGFTISVQEIARNAGGEGTPTNATATTSVAALPLRAIAGEHVSGVEGQAVTLDGSGSTPSSEISSYEWSFGDGASASGAVVRHVYHEPGTYSATLTVTRGGEHQSHSVTVTIEPRPAPAKAAGITLRGANNDSIGDATVLYIAGDGTRTEATTNGEGLAELPNLPPGADTVYAYKSGFRPATGQVFVDGEHTGASEITLEPGEVASTGLSSQELTLSEIVKAGIDPNEPANQTVYHFEAALEFVGSVTVELHGYINGEGQFAGGSAPSGNVTGGGGGPTVFHCKENAEEPERTSCEGTFSGPGGETHVVAVPTTIEKHPVIQWLILRTTAATVKQFFEVSMVVENLSAEEPFTLAPGTATLNIPAGLSLAPTASPQTLAQTVASIPPLGSVSTNWIVRGDAPGKYIPSATYESKLEPFETPVTLQSALVQPFTVWGTNALTPVLRADKGPAERGIPYHAVLGVKNTSDVPVYNVAITGGGSAQHFIFQPRQQFGTTIGELAPGQTVFGPEAIVVAQSPGEIFEEGPHEGRIIEERAAELAHVTLAGETGAEPGTVERLNPPKLYGMSDSANGHQIHLHWEQVPGAEGYEVYSTQSLATPFGEEPLSAPLVEGGEPATLLPPSASDAYVTGPAYFAVSTLLGGRLVLDHPVVESAGAERESKEREEQEELERNREKERKELEEREKREKKEKEKKQEREPTEPEPYVPDCFKGDAVNCLTGNHTETQTDLSVGGRGPGLQLARTYSSQGAVRAEAAGPFGYGWTGPYSAYLTVWRICDLPNKSCTETNLGGGYAVLHEANGAQVSFFHDRTGAHGWSAGATVLATLTEEGNRYVIRMPDGHTVTFNSGGRLSSEPSADGIFTITEGTLPISSEADRNGNTVSLSYEGSRLTKATDGAGRSLTFAYDAEGQVTSATDPLGHTVKYAYEHGNLASVTEPGETSPRWRFGYDASHEMTSESEGSAPAAVTEYDSAHRVVTQTDAMKRKRTWSYFVAKTFRLTTITEPNGSITREEFNEAGVPTNVTRAFDTSASVTTTSEYNSEGQLIATVDGNGHRLKYGYDAAGNRTSETDALGNTTSRTYNAERELTSETQPGGERTTFTRDADGNLLEASRPAPGGQTQVTKYTYDGSGDALTTTDALGHKWTYGYDQYGNRTSETDPEGDKRTFSYDLDSNMIASVSPRGNVAGAEASKFTTKTERDGQGRVIKTTNALGRTTTMTHNQSGTVASVTDANKHKTTYTYDADNELVKTTEADGATKETEYDAAGQVVAQIDGNGHKTTYLRNPLEEVTTTTDPLGHKSLKSYDGAGNVTSSTDARGKVAGYEYDADNHVTKVSYSDGTPTVQYEYDAHGHRTKMVDGSGTTTYSYDQLGRMIEGVDGHGARTAYEYDLDNHQVKLTYPNGDAVTRMFDNDGRLASMSDWLGDTTSFTYDPDSNPSSTVYPAATSEQETNTYNNADQLTATSIKRGTKLIGSLTYTRGKRGEVTKTTTKDLPGEEKTAYTFDASNRLTKAGTTVYAYDPAGNLVKAGTSTNTFNAGNELTASSTGATYAYDEDGRRIEATPAGGPTTTYGYDQVGDLTTVKRPAQGSVAAIEDAYAYNGQGLRMAQTVSGATSFLAWDVAGSMPLLLSDGTNNYVYGPEGLALEQISGTGAVLYLHHDQQGSTRMLTGATGTVEGTSTYGAYGGLTASTGSATTPLGYAGQYANADTGLTYLRARSYDPGSGQFTTPDPMVASTGEPYAYANDDPINNSDPSGLDTHGYCVGGGATLGPGSLAGSVCVVKNDRDEIGVELTFAGSVGVNDGVQSFLETLKSDPAAILEGLLYEGHIAYQSSNADLVCGLAGPFDFTHASVGVGVTVGGERFSNGEGGVSGMDYEVGLGDGWSLSQGVSQTVVIRFPKGSTVANIVNPILDYANEHNPLWQWGL
jgi:RHS repeat-associated protein